MQLRLQFPPTPEHMADHAALAVAAAADVAGIRLDYRVASLSQVDGILGGFYDDGVPLAELAETIFTFGAYVGEVIVRSASGRWVSLPDDHPLGGGTMVELPQVLVAD